eukprot:3510723-Karenia_brevis.AAC.1
MSLGDMLRMVGMFQWKVGRGHHHFNLDLTYPQHTYQLVEWDNHFTLKGSQGVILSSPTGE